VASARFEIYQDVSGKYRWRLIAAGGRVTAISGQAYTSADAAKRSATELHEQSAEASIILEPA
jgi:uncharacterized protein